MNGSNLDTACVTANRDVGWGEWMRTWYWKAKVEWNLSRADFVIPSATRTIRNAGSQESFGVKVAPSVLILTEKIGISGEETPLSPRHLPGGHVPSSRGGFLFSVPDVCFFRVPRDLVARLPLY